MSISADTLALLLDAGLEGEKLLAVVRSMEADNGSTSPPRSEGAERTRRYRERKAASQRDVTSDVTRHVTCDVTKAPPSLEKEVSPRPPSRKPNLSPENISGDGETPPAGPPPEPEGKTEFVDLAERLWSAQPVVGGKRRSTRPDVLKALDAAIRRGGRPGEIELACTAYFALPGSTKSGGEFAMGAARLLQNDRWREFAPAQVTSIPLVVWPGPAELRAEVVIAEGNGFALNYIDRSGWTEDPERKIVPRNGYAARQLDTQIGHILRKHGVAIQFEQAA